MSYSLSSNRQTKETENPVSLFPFLAVLLCTMGALISILLITARQAQISTDEMAQDLLNDTRESKSEDLLFDLSVPSEIVQEKESSTVENTDIERKIQELQAQNEQEKWRLEALQQVRLQVEKEAREARIALSTTQENRNQKIREMENFVEALQRLQTNSEADSEADSQTLQSEIATKEAEIQRLSKELEALENTAEKQNGSYAILPFAGNGTRRYPIYIECREDGAWLMPENLRLSAQDFEGALSMDNPLEMALMAKRQYLLRNGVFRETMDNEQEPYPLIVVRPAGIMYLYLVRSALQSWKSEYGYELVDNQLPVAYPPNDENLKREVTEAIQRGRLRQREIAAMAPTLPHYSGGGSAGSGGVVYHPTPRGGTAVNLDKNSRLARTLQRSATQAARNSATQMQGNENGSAVGNRAVATTTEGGIPRAGQMYVAGSVKEPHLAEPNRAYGSNGVHPDNKSDTGENILNASNGAIVAAAVNNLNHWSTIDTEENVKEGGNHTPGSTLDNMDGGAPENQTEGGGSSMSSLANGAETVEIATVEGQNWALEHYRPHLTSLTRPLPVECRIDRFILTGTPGVDQVEIPIDAPIPTIKKLVKEIGKKINSWGDAGRGAYWKPILRVRVMPGAHEQFILLQTLLNGSGLVVEEVK